MSQPDVTGGDARKRELVNYVATQLDTTKADATLIVESVADGIVSLSADRGSLWIPGLGNFRVIDMPERLGRNPKTGERLRIQSSKRITFKAARHFKSVVKQGEARC